jgi:GDSL-like Lipase/Acylhydrolase family
MRMSPLISLSCALAVVAAPMVTLTSVTPASASTRGYVALGDSYTSGPLILPLAAGAPLECGQSAINYPHLTAKALGLSLADVSCGGATVSNMTTSQDPGVPPQFDALSSTTSVVTMGIGGNDNNTFITAVGGCAALDILDVLDIGSPCKDAFGDTFANAIASDAPNIASAIEGIHALSPKAAVFVVGYPDILPLHGNCYPQLPITTEDIAYLRGVEQDLNAMLSAQAAAEGATFVNTYTPSIGHDACKSESVRWVEPVLPGTDAAPVHPNAKGEAADARDVEAAMSGAGIS